MISIISKCHSRGSSFHVVFVCVYGIYKYSGNRLARVPLCWVVILGMWNGGDGGRGVIGNRFPITPCPRRL